MKYTQGIATVVAVAGVAGLIVVGSLVFFNMQPKEEKYQQEAMEMMEEGEDMMKEGEEMMKEAEEMLEENTPNGAMEMMEDDSAMSEGYTGVRLAGTETTPLLEYNDADYKKATEEGKVIAMFFYANWCPTCKKEFPKMEAAFNDPALDGVETVGFRVSYKDNETSDSEESLAREFGVGYQHTKVLVKNGERVVKAPEGWEKDDYISNINSAL